MSIRLKLRRDTRAQGEPVAWFIPGAGPGIWLEELGAWSVPISEVVLHAVPRSAKDRTPCGVLAVTKGERPVHPSPRALPYRVVAQDFYIPCDARLDPPVDSGELEKLCQYQRYIFHPVAGLVGLDEGDVWKVTDLLQVPVVQESGWMMPHPGLPDSAILKSVFRIMPEDPADIIAEGQSDIGQSELGGIPPIEGEPSRTLPAQSMRQMRLLISGLGMKFVDLFPRTSPTRTWINDLEDWLNRQRNEALGGIDRARSPELHRLLDLLNRDPDEGLKFAIPLNPMGGRGIDQDPGGNLGKRNVDFDIRGLGGGQAISNWIVDPVFFQKMRQAYLAAANQELAAGRFRRAAYVYAHLLNDFEAAAKALQRGGHHHEAAELYLKKMNDIRSAAKCLYDGGYFSEAVVHFTDLGDHEMAGDIHRRLGDEESARTSYLTAVKDLVERDNILAAAVLLDHKLHDQEEALGILGAAWPGHLQAEKCLAAGFELRGRLGRHSESLDLVRILVADTGDPGSAATLIRVFAILKNSYPDPDLRTAVTDGARVVAGRNLPAAGYQQLENLTRDLRLIHPDDPLFLRDTQRYLKNSGSRKTPGLSGHLHQVDTFKVMPGVDWSAGTGGPPGVLACGFKPGRLVILHGSWNSELRHEEISLEPEFGSLVLDQGEPANIKVTGPDSQSVTIMIRVNGANVDFFTQPVPTSWGARDQLAFARSFWLPNDAVCMAHGVAGRIFVIRFTGLNYLLEEYSSQGKLQEQAEIPYGLEGEEGDFEKLLPCRVTDTGHHAVATIGDLLVWRARREMSFHTLNDLALGLTPFYHGNESMVAVSHLRGVTLVKIEPNQMTFLARDMTNPLTLFLPSRLLIVVGSDGRVYDTRKGPPPQLLDTFQVGPGQPCALVRGPVGNQFAILYDDGMMRMYSTGRED